MMEERTVSIATDVGQVKAALIGPTAVTSPGRGVVIAHEIFGLNDDMRRIARTFAEAGYVALVPDLFGGRGTRALCILRTVASFASGGGRPLQILEGARAFLAADHRVDDKRIGVAGFCLGGGFAVLMGTTNTVGVVATFYGKSPRRAQELANVCPVVGSFGELDGHFAKEGRRLEHMLAAVGAPHDVKIYPAVGHSFMSRHEGIIGRLGARGPLKVGYDAEAARDSWSRVLSFFDEHLAEEQ